MYGGPPVFNGAQQLGIHSYNQTTLFHHHISGVLWDGGVLLAIRLGFGVARDVRNQAV